MLFDTKERREDNRRYLRTRPCSSLVDVMTSFRKTAMSRTGREGQVSAILHMQNQWRKSAHRALKIQRNLGREYETLLEHTENPRLKSILHDLLVTEEMNEVLLRNLTQY